MNISMIQDLKERGLIYLEPGYRDVETIFIVAINYENGYRKTRYTIKEKTYLIKIPVTLSYILGGNFLILVQTLIQVITAFLKILGACLRRAKV